MQSSFLDHVQHQVQQLRAGGFYKAERVVASQQSAQIVLADGSHVLNFCANNYLGLANDQRLIDAAKHGLDDAGFGLSSVRFICGTQTGHKKLEHALADFLQMQDAILYSSCFDANGGLFEALLDENDAVISDALNHASIIDGVRLCKAKRFRYNNNDMADLRAQLQAADLAGARYKLIATDGVFSMDGIIADLKSICDLAEEFNAMVMVDDSHAVGFIGENGRGTPEYCGVQGRIHIITGTLGKALGGASGGYVAADAAVVELLRQRSRPYLFSNTLAPAIVSASLRVLTLLQSDEGKELRRRVHANGRQFRSAMLELGFELMHGEHPIIPVMFGDAQLAGRVADELLHEGIYVISFSYPVVPKGRARIRTQMSAAHSAEHIDKAVEAFKKVGQRMQIIP
ncbi:glycine C-acetyltransferase [Candidimonas sp. SYP-B2681]|uniref:glycine C-acetyltransferase n=1 Tax=Candidimonas sp. SYP-B2681 TaxID=2497686 RepID=UPI000F89B033|nr:glycine C-acetyltransferase [Candidimonas sp. SYP-B2681]RTZ45613.1 glycine C-acetyltransferase [Candidimonas sp. SYP-B2681]